MTSQKIVNLSEIIIPKYYGLVNDARHTHKIIDSGRSGTKSSFLGIISLYFVIAYPNTSIVIIRKHHNKLRKTIYKEVIRAIDRLGLSKTVFNIKKSPMEITYIANGNTIYFTGSDNIDDTKGIIDEKRPIRLVGIDEVTEFFNHGDGQDELANIEATFVRGNNTRFDMYYLFNPPKNANAPIMRWMRSMELRDDTVHVHNDYRDVPAEWLGQKLIDSAEQMKKADEAMYQWLWLGECVGSPEIVYYMFDSSMVSHRKNFSEFIHVGIAIDYGQLNATTFQAFGMNTNGLGFEGIAEYYHSGRNSGMQKTPSEYAKDFEIFYKQVEKLINSDENRRKKIEAVYIDPSARGLNEEIRRIMPDVKIINANNSVMLGIERTQKLFSFDKLKINISQKNLLNEIELYKLDTKKLDYGKEEVVKDNDHTMDAMRYYVMGMWRFIRSVLPYTERGD